MGSTGKARVDYRAVQLHCMIQKTVEVAVKAAKWFIGNQFDDLSGFPKHTHIPQAVPSYDA